MSNAIEIEVKVLLDEKDYQKLMTIFNGNPAYTQTNYYIDNDEGQLRKEGLGLRIREKNGLYEMTLKTPLSQGLLEKNCAWTKEQFDSFKGRKPFPEGDIKRFLTMMDIDTSTLYIKTSLTTKRMDVPYEGGKLSIDENHYSNITDYEIELEHNNEKDAERILKDLLEKEKIPFSINSKTKVSRAMDALEK